MVEVREPEKPKTDMVELGNKLFDDTHLERNTNVLHDEVPILNILQVFGQIQDDYRLKLFSITEKCVLTKVVNSSLKLRSSIKGWRSNQVVEILKAGKVEHTSPLLTPFAPQGKFKE